MYEFIAICFLISTSFLIYSFIVKFNGTLSLHPWCARPYMTMLSTTSFLKCFHFWAPKHGKFSYRHPCLLQYLSSRTKNPFSNFINSFLFFKVKQLLDILGNSKYPNLVSHMNPLLFHITNKTSIKHHQSVGL